MADTNRKGKRKASGFEILVGEDGGDGECLQPELMDGAEALDGLYVPMQPPSGIEDLRAKLRAKMATLGKGAANQSDDAHIGDKDALLEHRRQQRAELRERRRKETKEKIRRERASKGKRKETTNGSIAKVCHQHSTCLFASNIN
jgi:hypothetical protein